MAIAIYWVAIFAGTDAHLPKMKSSESSNKTLISLRASCAIPPETLLSAFSLLPILVSVHSGLTVGIFCQSGSGWRTVLGTTLWRTAPGLGPEDAAQCRDL